MTSCKPTGPYIIVDEKGKPVRFINGAIAVFTSRRKALSAIRNHMRGHSESAYHYFNPRESTIVPYKQVTK